MRAHIVPAPPTQLMLHYAQRCLTGGPMPDARSVRLLHVIAAAAIVAWVAPSQALAITAEPRPRQVSNVEIRAAGKSNGAPTRTSRKWDLTLPHVYIEPAHIVTATGEALSA